jgi:hypothetical protein
MICRTEDGDDVSQNFERALQSMGAKTRRTFSGIQKKKRGEEIEKRSVSYPPE